MAYTTIALVSAELNGASITPSTVPSSTTVGTWITQVEAEIDNRTGKHWETGTATNEILDYDGNGFLRLLNAPLLAVSTLAYEENGLGADSASWVSLTKGRAEDYITYLPEAEIEFIASVPAGIQNIKSTYTYGYSVVPSYIQRLATLMVAKRSIDAVVNNSASNEGGSVTVGNISITDPSNFSTDYIKNLNNEINELFTQQAGSSRVFRSARKPRSRY